VLSHDEQRGAGGAVKTGYLAALDGDADLVATVDGDGQMDPRRLDRFLDPLVDGDADYAKGTRLSRREHTAGMPAFRLFGNRLLTLLCRLSSGYWSLTDPVNGYTAIRREALKAIDPASAYEDTATAPRCWRGFTPPAAESLMCRIRAATATKTAGSTTGSTPPE